MNLQFCRIFQYFPRQRQGIHSHILSPNGHRRQQLAGKGEAHLCGPHPLKQPIVVAYAPAQTAACRIKGQARHDGKRHLSGLQGLTPGRRRLPYAITADLQVLQAGRHP